MLKRKKVDIEGVLDFFPCLFIFTVILLTEYKQSDFRGLPPAAQTMDVSVIDCDVLDKIKVPHATCLVCYYNTINKGPCVNSSELRSKTNISKCLMASAKTPP